MHKDERVTDAMVEAGLAEYSEGGCMGLDDRERREVVTAILHAALSSPEEEKAVKVKEAEGWELVPKSAIMWLIGAGPDANGDWFEKPEGAPAFWWRTHFNKLRADAVKSRSALVDVPAVESEPVAHLVWRQYLRAADDVEDYYEVARPGDKCVDGSAPFPVYTHPPRTTPVPALVGEDGWLPIETAPTDGTEIIGIFSNDYGWQEKPTVYGPYTLRFRGGDWVASWDGGMVIRSQSDFGTEYEEPMPPTHWRPLPAPPLTRKASTEEVGGSTSVAKDAGHG